MTTEQIKELFTSTFRGEVVEETETKVVIELRGKYKFDIDIEHLEEVRKKLGRI